MKTKMIRIYWRDWRKVRKLFPGIRGETCAEYLARIISMWEDYHNEQ